MGIYDGVRVDVGDDVLERLAGLVADDGIEHEALEVFLRGRIEAGGPISEAYPPNERVKAEYAAYRAARGPESGAGAQG